MTDGLTEAEESVMVRIAELEALAREMLASFTDHGICHRARVLPAQIARWQEKLGAP